MAERHSRARRKDSKPHSDAPRGRDRLALTAASGMQQQTRDRWYASIALVLAALAAATAGCGPRVIVARIVTPTPAAGEPSPPTAPLPSPRRAAFSPTRTPP